MTKTFKINSNGKIELSKEELDNILTDIYNTGYDDGLNIGKSNQYTWHSPYHWWDYTTFNNNSITYSTTADWSKKQYNSDLTSSDWTKMFGDKTAIVTNENNYTNKLHKEFSNTVDYDLTPND